jgi:hypothetical protein
LVRRHAVFGFDFEQEACTPHIATVPDVAHDAVAIQTQLLNFFRALWRNLALSTSDPFLQNGGSVVQKRIRSQHNEFRADHE